MRKHLIHRQGRLGYSADALRGFAFNAFHGSHQIARLEYGARLSGHMDDMQRQQEAAHNNPDLTDTDKNANQFWLRYAQPFSIGGTNWLLRASLPISTFPLWEDSRSRIS